MKPSGAIAFTKALSCPSSNMLLSFRTNALAPELRTLLKHHLMSCDFCCAELPLLAHYEPPVRGECKPPEIPINLRILAESLLSKSARQRRLSRKNESLTFGLVAES